MDTRGGGGAPIRNPDNGQLVTTVSGRLTNDDMVKIPNHSILLCLCLS